MDPRANWAVYTKNILAALEPFSPIGALNDKISGEKTYPRFRLDDLFDRKKCVAVLLTAREVDAGSKSVLSLAMRTIRQLRDTRVGVSEDDTHPILLLLDEASRIVGFDPNDHVARARKCLVPTVFVFQDLQQISDNPTVVLRFLSNVGTQIYLGPVRNPDLKLWFELVGMSKEWSTSSTDQSTLHGDVFSQQAARVTVPYLGAEEARNPPSGPYPALVYMRATQGFRKPFFVTLAKEDGDDDD